MPSSSRTELEGPRPPPLMVNKASFKVKKPAAAADADRREPVVVYVPNPKVIHAQPRNFMSLVQHLTGKPSSWSSPSTSFSSFSPLSSSSQHGLVEGGGDRSAARKDMIGGGEVDGDGDMLLLTLGQSVPSPIISPSLLFCSPTAQPSLQDFSLL